MPQEPTCLDPLLIDIPAPGSVAIDCLSGPVGPPPPPPPPPPPGQSQFRFIDIKETGSPDKQFNLGSEPPFVEDPEWRIPWGFPRILGANEKYYSQIGFVILYQPVGNNQYTPTLSALPFVVARLEIMIGYRDGPNGFAPTGALGHLPPNSAWLFIPNLWIGGGPIVIETFNPFKATMCLTNNIVGGKPDYSQCPLGSSNNLLIAQIAWSPPSDRLAGSSLKFSMTERFV